MGVFIKGMEMPERCGQCFLRVGNCKQRIYMEQRPKNCPLVEIPTPHGRLIDADAIQDYNEATHDYNNIKVVSEYDIADAPTVIEAEGETDGR